MVAFTVDAFAQLDEGVQDAANIWTGHDDRVSVKEIALRVAPILWFTSDEPHVLAKHPTPMALPCDFGDKSKPVVYYRRVDVTQSPEWLTPTDSPILEYYFYYLHDYGPRCHSNDFESARMALKMTCSNDVARNRSCSVSLRSVEGAAHGSAWYANRLNIGHKEVHDMSLPPTLLVEEGKHAVAPDRNGDGHYTPGYDVNDRANDAWGVRDGFGAGYWWAGSAYSAHMTKPRNGTTRIMVDAGTRRETLWARSYRSTWWKMPTHTYELREFPTDCAFGDDAANNESTSPTPNAGCYAERLADLVEQKTRSRGLLSEFFDLREHFHSQWAFGGPIDHALRVRWGFPKSVRVGWLNFGGSFATRRAEPREQDLPQMCLNEKLRYRPEGEGFLTFSPSLARPRAWFLGGGLAIGNLYSCERVERLSIVPFFEVGIEARWHPWIRVAVGIKYYRDYGASPIFGMGPGRIVVPR